VYIQSDNVAYKGRLFYYCPEHRSCHGISRWMQAFCATSCLSRCSDKRKTA